VENVTPLASITPSEELYQQIVTPNTNISIALSEDVPPPTTSPVTKDEALSPPNLNIAELEKRLNQLSTQQTQQERLLFWVRSFPRIIWIGLVVAVTITIMSLISGDTFRQIFHADIPAGSVVIYEYPNYTGNSLTLTQSDLELCDNPVEPKHGPVEPCFTAASWNDIASSIHVSTGYRATVYQHSEQHGRLYGDDIQTSYTVKGNVPDFSELRFPNGVTLNDNISRIVIERCEIDSCDGVAK
jgi:hypothetical protein